MAKSKNKTGGGTYEQLAEWLNSNISNADIRRINKKLSKSFYQDNPKEIHKEIEKFFIKDIWDKKADKSPRVGNPKTQRENAISGVINKITNLDKTTYKDPYSGQTIDFNPILEKYRDVQRLDVKEQEVSSRIKKITKTLTAPTKKELLEIKKNWGDVTVRKPSKSVLYKRVDKAIDNSIKGQNVENLKELRDAVKDIYYAPTSYEPKSNDQIIKELRNSGMDAGEIDSLKMGEPLATFAKLKKAAKKRHIDIRDLSRIRDNRPLTSYQSYELFEKIDKALDPYKRKVSRLSSKTDDELRNSLRLEGVSQQQINKWTTSKELKKQADKRGIGLRQYNKNRNELIDAIIKNRPGAYSKKELDNVPLGILKGTYKKEKKEVEPLRTKPYIDYKDLPTSRTKVKKLYGDKGVRLTDKEVSQVTDRILRSTPFINESELNFEINRRLASKVESKPILDKELEQRYMDWQYDDSKRVPSYTDLRDLSKFTQKDFKFELAKKIDPISGKEKEKSRIPYQSWRVYKKNLKQKVKKIEAIRKEVKRTAPDVQAELVQKVLAEQLADTKVVFETKKGVKSSLIDIEGVTETSLTDVFGRLEREKGKQYGITKSSYGLTKKELKEAVDQI